MSSLSDFTEGELIKHYFRTNDVTPITVLAFVLLTVLANDADTGVFTGGTDGEIDAGAGYLRQNRPPLDGNWTAPTSGDGTTDNVAVITYPVATADYSAGVDIVGMAITNNVTIDNGDMLFHAAVTTAKPVLNGDTAEFGVGAVLMTWD